MLDIDTYLLKINYFFISNKDEFKKWWVIVLIAIDVFIVVFVFTNLIVYLTGMIRQNKMIVAMADSPIDYRMIREQNKPVPLEVVSTTALAVSGNKFDLVAQVKNNNKNWMVEKISYHFTLDGEPTDASTDIIMPNTEKFLTALGVSNQGKSGRINISMEIESIEWRRVDDPDQLSSINFTIEDVNYSSTTTAEGQLVNLVKGKVINSTYRSFWKTRFVVVLFSGAKIVGVDYIYFDQFKVGEERSLYVQWELISASVTGVSVIPDFNLLDAENIIK